MTGEPVTGRVGAGESEDAGETGVRDQPALLIAPPAFLAEPAFAALLAALPDARVVGGAVRDTLAGRPVADIDLGTKLPPAEVMAALRRAGIRAVPTGLGHGTVTAVLDPLGGQGGALGGGRSVEITTLRRDVATDGRHATVAFTDDWRQDAVRRDLTLNAMSMTRGGAVYDYFGGVADLRAGVLRFVGDPAQRIAEDFLRVLRYFRFFARYADRPPELLEPSTLPEPPTLPDAAVRAALRAGIGGLSTLSAERVWSELRRILGAPDPGAAVALMAELGVLPAVIPEGADPAALARLIAAGGPVDEVLRLAALLTGDVECFADRLRLSGAERQRLLDLRASPVARPEDDDAALRRLLADHDRAVLIDRTWLVPDGLGGGAQSGWVALRGRLAALPKPVFPLQGADVLALGVAPGPRVGVLLRAVRDWWVAGGCTAGVAACRAELVCALGRPLAGLSSGPLASG